MKRNIKRNFLYFLIYGNFAVIFWFWWQGSGVLFAGEWPGYAIALGRISGLLAVSFVLFQFVLVGRNPWIEQAFGLDRMTHFHHTTGLWSLVFLIAHPFFILVGYSYQSGTGLLEQFINLIENYEGVWFAVLALILFISLVIVSLRRIRRRFKYELWYYSHLIMYLAVILAWWHQLPNGGDFLSSDLFTKYWYFLYIAVFGNLFYFRILRPLVLFSRHRFHVVRVERENHNVVSIYIGGKNLHRFKVKAGQFLIYRFLSKKFIWQAHPFSLSWSPNHESLRITVKNVGDYTSQIPNVPLHTHVLIDGPYGVFTEEASRAKKLLMIAGGIGITPVFSLIESLAGKKDLVLLYGNKKEEDIVFRKKIDELSSEHGFPTHYIVSDEKEKSPLRRGLIDGAFIKELVPDFLSREVYLCGPKPMMLFIIKELEALGMSKEAIHYERFALR